MFLPQYYLSSWILGSETVWPTKQEACKVNQRPAKQQRPDESSSRGVRRLIHHHEKVRERKTFGHAEKVSFSDFWLVRFTADVNLCAFFRDFLNNLRFYLTFYAGLADELCMRELSSGDGQPCWNGTNIVKRFVSNKSLIQLYDKELPCPCC